MNPHDPHTRILEIHPVPFTRLLHRNIPSGGRERDGLGVPLLLQAIGDAASLGYHVLRIGGEEPLHCPALHALCGEAHRQGMQTTLDVPQSAITERLIDELRGAIDRVGIVLQGRPAVHGRVRKCHRTKLAREQGLAFNIIFTLTKRNLGDLEWAWRFAAEHGAAGLTVRAGEVGETQLASAWMVLEVLRDQHRGGLPAGFSEPHRYDLPVTPEQLTIWEQGLRQRPGTLGRVVSPLVIASDGTAVPLRQDFPRTLAFGDLRRQPLRLLAETWIARCSGSFAEVYGGALALAQESSDRTPQFFDLLAEEAGRSRPAAFAVAG
jgi:hypothetical protein